MANREFRIFLKLLSLTALDSGLLWGISGLTEAVNWMMAGGW